MACRAEGKRYGQSQEFHLAGRTSGATGKAKTHMFLVGLQLVREDGSRLRVALLELVLDVGVVLDLLFAGHAGRLLVAASGLRSEVVDGLARSVVGKGRAGCAHRSCRVLEKCFRS